MAKIPAAVASLLNSQKADTACLAGGKVVEKKGETKPAAADKEAEPKAKVAAKRILQGVVVKKAEKPAAKGKVTIKVNAKPVVKATAGVTVKVDTKKAEASVKKVVADASKAVKGAYTKTKDSIRIVLGKGMSFTNKGTPAEWLAGTPCQASFKKAWNGVQNFLAMRDNAYDYALACVKSISDVRSQTICAACDPANEKNFASSTKLGVSIKSLDGISSSCGAFMNFLTGFHKVSEDVAAYAASVSKAALGVPALMKVEANVIAMGGLSDCGLTGPAKKPAADAAKDARRLQKVAVKAKVP